MIFKIINKMPVKRSFTLSLLLFPASVKSFRVTDCEISYIIASDQTFNNSLNVNPTLSTGFQEMTTGETV